MKKALITGITGQDGAYLAEFLLAKGYEVHGVKRRTSLFNTDRIDHLYQDPHDKDRRFFLHHGDMTDSSSLTRIIQQVLPDEIFLQVTDFSLCGQPPQEGGEAAADHRHPGSRGPQVLNLPFAHGSAPHHQAGLISNDGKNGVSLHEFPERAFQC